MNNRPLNNSNSHVAIAQALLLPLMNPVAVTQVLAENEKKEKEMISSIQAQNKDSYNKLLQAAKYPPKQTQTQTPSPAKNYQRRM